MASSDNMASFETWVTCTTFDNSWYTDAFARDNEALTKALTQSLTNGADVGNVSFPPETPEQALLPVHSVSTSGGSEPERETLSVSKRVGVRNGVSGKIAKRKSRASKRSQTTFITADPANFRQMVQQVTGVGFGLGTGLIKPEPQRAGLGNGIGNGNGNGGYMLPTLDTSAFLLDHHQQVVGPASVSGGTQVQAGGTGFDFDGFSCFPTLESWKVM